MDIRKLKQDAEQTLSSASYSPNRLVLIHTAAALVLSLALMAISQILSGSMGSAGGLSGMGTQTILATAQVMLQLVSVGIGIQLHGRLIQRYGEGGEQEPLGAQIHGQKANGQIVNAHQ